MPEFPKYYLADVPHDLRTRVLDRCFRRLYHEGLELLHEHGIYHYNRDDLINFYNWAPSTLPEPPSPPLPPPDPPVLRPESAPAPAPAETSAPAVVSIPPTDNGP